MALLSHAYRLGRASLRTSMRAMPAGVSIQRGQAITKRCMSSSGGHGPKSTSDMPWIVSSIGFALMQTEWLSLVGWQRLGLQLFSHRL
jgi:hypothetical protein